MPDRQALRQLALVAARAAADRVRTATASGRPLTAEVKGVSNYVTAVDREAETAALSTLRQATPDIAVVGEESGGSLDSRVWVVDPVDGTTNLICGFPVVGVSVALIEDGEPVVAAIVSAHTGDTWTAIAGEGAWDGRGRRLHLSGRQPTGVMATGVPARTKRRLALYMPVFERALQRFDDLRRTGAATLDLAYTAAGTFDGFFELGLAIWDIAAGTLMVREAGGVVTDWHGDQRAFFESGDIVAGRREWHEAMLDVITDAAA
jgi:myo-inositol-1(or 4)-monophosphatase